MTERYETMQYGYSGWQATTFGCTCCSDQDDISGKDAITELKRISEMYARKANKYWRMAEIAEMYDVPGAFKRWSKWRSAQSDLNTLSQVLDGENCGTYGQKLEKTGLENLVRNLAECFFALLPEDDEIAEAMGW